MKVYAVESSNIEGLHSTHDIYSSYDLALEAVHKLMETEFVFAVGPECWKPHPTINNWWFYGCDSVGIEEYEVKTKLEKEVVPSEPYPTCGEPGHPGCVWCER